MPEGFFPASVLDKSKKPESLIPKCGACGLYKTCQSPKMELYGQGEKGIMIIGEAPGADEDEQGIPFVGKSGRLLREVLSGLGIHPKRDLWITNSLICRPPGNRTPTAKEIDYCRPNITRAIRECKPRTLILLGLPAIKSVIGSIQKDVPTKITPWVGWQIPCQRPHMWICPTYHPSFILREQDKRPIARKLFEQHIEAAISLKEKPELIANFDDAIQKIYDPVEVERRIRLLLASSNKKTMIAFDYETNMVKPDSHRAEIICCSISTGFSSFAFPWPTRKETLNEFSTLLKSDIPKIGQNIKFEDRWTRAKLGHGIKNWYWDDMLAAHWMDSRGGITGLKFQAFAHMGLQAYDEHIKPYLKAKGGSKLNRILEEIDMDDLLHYCALDSYFEFKLGVQQMKKSGYPLPWERSK